MVDIVDVVQETGEFEAVEQQVEKQEQEAPEVKPEPPKPDLPEKYRNKSVEDVIKMHQEAEKLASRQAQEVGEVRKLADELLKAQFAKKPEIEKPKEVDFFENPQEAIRQAVESNPRVLAAEQYAVMARQEQNRQRLLQKHPDLPSIVSDGEFMEYVKSSPVRMRLFNEADANYDFDAGDELLSTFKQIKSAKQAQQTQVPETEKIIRKQSVATASVETGGTSESSKKVFRRADLMRLMQNDPSRYEAMQDEIVAAYREGRVK